jgi:hypothetical protein
MTERKQNPETGNNELGAKEGQRQNVEEQHNSMDATATTDDTSVDKNDDSQEGTVSVGSGLGIDE